jgi:hypothetical protein
MYYSTWAEVIIDSFRTIWINVITSLPKIFLAVVIFIVGWIFAVGLGKLVARGVRMTRVDVLLERLGLREPLERAGYKLDAGVFLGALVRWLVIGTFLIFVSDVLQLRDISIFLTDVVMFIPNIIIAAVIMLVAVIAADFLDRLIRASVKVGGLASGKFLASLARYSVLVFAFLTALMQLKVAPVLIQTFITGFVAMLAIAGGIAFGLGGKDNAAQLIGKLKQQISEDHTSEGK